MKSALRQYLSELEDRLIDISETLALLFSESEHAKFNMVWEDWQEQRRGQKKFQNLVKLKSRNSLKGLSIRTNQSDTDERG